MANATEGKKAPAFKTTDHNDEKIALSQFKGQWVVLYFYPKDNTPGCTVEACDARDAIETFHELDAVVLGVSRDSQKSHHKFVAKYELPFPLLMDEEGALCEKYGVWQEKKNYGKTYMGIVRTTFLIDPAGKIAKVYAKVKTKGHMEAVIADLRALQD